MDALTFDICEALNDDFGVDVTSLPPEDASPSVSVVPHFLPEPETPFSDVRTQFVMDENRQFQGSLPSQTAIPAPLDRSPNPWDPRLVLDLALGIDALSDILERYGLDDAAYGHLSAVPSFRRALALTMREVRENGLSFAKKAAVQAESYLVVVDDMIHDAAVPASTRLDAVKWVTTQGRLDPKQDKAEGGTNAQQVNISINFT